MTTTADGDINYDAILRQGAHRDKRIVSDHSALVPKVDRLAAEDMEKPDDDEVALATKETAAALEALVNKKITAAQPKSIPAQPGGATYIKYTPANRSAAHNSGAQARVIKMQDMPVDPLEPPKFRHVKVPRGSGSPPVPVMHSPPRPVTVSDQQDWKIPPCISNWKNPKGYTIPLDKRLAADGRGLQETQINDGFAKLTEALYVAESKAREAVETRAKLQREVMAKEKERKERELRELAMRARMDRLGGNAAGAAAAAGGAVRLPDDAVAAPAVAAAAAGDVGYGAAAAAAGGDEQDDLPEPPRRGETREEAEERRQRDEIREERRKERERDRRREAAGGRKSAGTRDRERDISEKIALGMANVRQGEVMYDQRLFNQEGGMDSGLAQEDTYNLYDKPLYAERGSNQYRPKGAEEDDAGEARTFRPDKGFSGVDYGQAGAGRSGPVQFEKEAEDEDVFGLNDLMQDVKAGKKRKAAD